LGNLVGCSWILFWNCCNSSIDWSECKMCVIFQSLWYLSDVIDSTLLCLSVRILLGLWIFTKRVFSIIKNPNNFTATDESSPVQICMCSTMLLYKSKALLSFAHCIQKGTLKAWKLLCWEEELFRSPMFSSCAWSMEEPLKKAVLRISTCLNSILHGPLILKMPSKGLYWNQFQIGP